MKRQGYRTQPANAQCFRLKSGSGVPPPQIAKPLAKPRRLINPELITPPRLQMKMRLVLPILILALALCGHCAGIEPTAQAAPECIDKIAAVASVDPALDSDFFRTKRSTYPSHIIEHKDGHLESTLGDKVSKQNTPKIEYTSNCLSSHQGEHLMGFCDAQQLDGGVLLQVAGGLPAYASGLTLLVDKDKNLTCRFEAVYPMAAPGEKLSWTITKKTFKMQSAKLDAGARLLGWLSVEFDETCVIKDQATTNRHKIEGYVKPIISKPGRASKPTAQKPAADRALPTGQYR